MFLTSIIDWYSMHLTISVLCKPTNNVAVVMNSSQSDNDCEVVERGGGGRWRGREEGRGREGEGERGREKRRGSKIHLCLCGI